MPFIPPAADRIPQPGGGVLPKRFKCPAGFSPL